MHLHPVLKFVQQGGERGTRRRDSRRRGHALSAQKGEEVMRAHAAGGGIPRRIPSLVVLGKITAERLKACGIQALYSNASSLGPCGKLRCPKKTAPYR